MKVGIVGTGAVGATAAFALVMKGVGRRIVLVDANVERARAEADDILHAVPFAAPLQITPGDYADLVGCRVVIGQKPGESRLQLLSRNAAVFRDVIPAVLDVAPEAILIVATNPVDVMTHVAARLAADFGIDPHRVIGSGTMLDTARFRTLLGRAVGIDSRHVHAYVVGEHGDSEERARIDDGVRHAAYRIIEGKGATYYGVASALASMTTVVLHDRRALMTVCTPQTSIAGVHDVTVSMPHVVGGEGVIGAHHPLSLDDSEQEALHRSAALIREQIEGLGTGG